MSDSSSSPSRSAAGATTRTATSTTTTTSSKTVVQLLYPATATFNLSYYLTIHVPKIKKAWAGMGLRDALVTTLDKDSGYQVQLMMFWESSEAFGQAITSEGGARLMGEIGNFSDQGATWWVGDVLADVMEA